MPVNHFFQHTHTESLLTVFFWPDATRDCLGAETVVEMNIISGVKHEP
jgi:hypothetical protein